MLAARARQLTLCVHAVDDTGALCGARPTNGNWIESKSIPVNCPRCLYAMSRPRYAVCEIPQPRRDRPMHLRVVGPEGVQKRSGLRVLTLCGLPVGWDVGAMTSPVDPRLLCQRCARIIATPGQSARR